MEENEKYVPPYDLTNKMLETVAQIMERIGEITAFANLNNQIQLLRRNRIHSIHSSLAIEDNHLTVSQVEDVINGKPVIGDKKEIQEVKNALDAYSLIDEIDPYSIKDLKRIQYEMMKGIKEDAGEFRKGAEGVFDGNTVIHIAPPAKMVAGLIEQLFDYLITSKDNLLIKSCVFHYEFEFIHPFSDGNGRTGRFWQSAILSRYKPIFKYLPIENILKAEQTDYYNAFSLSNSEGKSNVFIEFMLNVILKAVNTSNIKPTEKFVSPQVEALLKVIDEYPKSTKELMELLNLKSRISFRDNYLNPALEQNLIKMTFPDKPTSRNQRYFKK
ncbi:MAG: Fic family protein [Spirochaetales bacterium]